MWRYDAVLPDADPVSLGEGFTPMLLSREYPSVYIKDEGLNPTGSFKARGLSACRHHGSPLRFEKTRHPFRGKRRRRACRLLLPPPASKRTSSCRKMFPMANRIECDYYGAHVTLVDGLISDCASKVADLKASESWNKDGWFDVSTTKEPYRVEGKKTMGYEVAEQLGWRMPQGIIYPTGGGVGLLGMWKAFEEMEALGWISAESRFRAPEDDHRASRRLRTHRESLGRREAVLRKCGRTPRPWRQACASPSPMATI